MMTEVLNFLTEITEIIDMTTIQVGRSTISLLEILQAIFYLLLVFIISHYFNKLLKNYLLVKFFTERGIRFIVADIISYSCGTLALIIILQLTGFNLSILAVLSGGLGLGIGLGLQNLSRDFISGISVLIERKIQIGHFIKFKEFQGFVQEISPRSVIMRLKDGSSVVIPNSHLVDHEVVNCHYETNCVRLTLLVGVAYGSDPVFVTETLLLSTYSERLVLQSPAPQVIFKNFGDSSLNFELWIWIDSNNMDLQFEIISSLSLKVEYYFRLREIEIAFPQQALWLKNPQSLQPLFSGSQSYETPSKTIPTNSLISIRDILHNTTYFNYLDEIELRQLIEIGRLQTLKDQEILFHENDVGDAFYIILSGKVEIFTEVLGKTLAILDAGNCFGELSLMLGVPRSATVKAIEETVLFGIHHAQFKRLLQENETLRETLVQELIKHQEELSQRRIELQQKGLVTVEESEEKLISWLRKRLKFLFD